MHKLIKEIMSKTTCYTPLKGVDDVIAAQVPSWNSHYVANLRGMYEEAKGKSTTDVNELLAFRRSLNAKDAKALTEAITNPIAAYDQLKEAFSTQERVDRVNMIANTFSDVVDAIQESNPSLSREDIIMGYTDQNGKFQGGPAFIYSEVYKTLKAEMDEYAENGYEEEVEKYRQVFKNWGALVTYANTILRDTEGLKIGTKLTFADSSTIADYDENTAVESFVAEEAPRESWQEVSESVSPFGSTSILVRRLLGRLSGYTSNNEEDYDDLGHLRRLPAVQVHQALMEALRGMQSESDMVAILKQNMDSKPYISAIFEEFAKDPILRTQFFVDFSKVFQLYSMQNETRKGDITTYKNSVLNILSRKSAYKRYSAALATRTLKADNAVFRYEDEGTLVNEARAKQLADFIEKYLGTDQDIFNKFNERGFSNQDRIDFYKAVLPVLGINLAESDYDVLVKDNKKVMSLNRTLKDLPTVLRKAKDGMKFQDLIDLRIGRGASEGYLREKIGKIFQVTESLDSGKKVLSRVRFQDNTYYSDIQSSYLGRFRDTIDALARKGNKAKLQSYLEEHFLRNDFFRSSDGKIYNKWLQDLYYSNLQDQKSFANMFTYKKFLGDDNQKFEDFTGKKQAITLINEYFAESKDYAWYPVFILGDSGASKWIRAKRYSSDQIVTGLYNVYLQEKIFQREIKELKEGLKRDGKSLGSLAKIDETKFGLLPFLNEKKYSDMIDMTNIEQSVKAAIKAHLRDAFNEYMVKLSRAGVLGKTQKGDYKYLSELTKFTTKDKQKLTGDEAVKANLMDYFYNSKFATVMQMQIMTVNPIFYKNGDSTDVQKRYKEIHASGNRVSIEAVNPFTGERFSNRDYQTTVYFDDVEVNPEDTNPEFMEVIAKVYGKDSEVYKTYRDKTSFTDGQGYRTLKSYKAVMGMAGKWNKKCEDAYNEIESIRADIRSQGGEITDEQAQRIANLMVTFQPIKPFTYTLERWKLGNSIFQIPVQMKYAETVMIPELMQKGSKLRDMLEWAEKPENDVDVIAATTAVKVGSFGAVNVKDATNKDELKASLDNAIIHNLSYNDYVIQNNIPEHIQGSQLFATQSRKLIFAGLQQIDANGNTIYYDHYTDGNRVNLGNGMVRLNAYNLNRFYISLIAANILEDFEEFSSTIRDPEKVRQALVQMTVNNSRETRDNLRGYGKGMEHDFLMALFEGGIEHDTAALLLSMFKKQVNKQKINGGSAVQVSAFGITGYTEDNNLRFVKDPNNDANILYAECELPWDLSYTDSNGNKVELQFSDWCNADGTLKMGKNGVSLLETKFPGITSFIAYRIPTEDKYSMLNLRVKRFTQKVNGGGTIKVPAQGTTIAGFDFDIDKLYFMRREYKVKKSDKDSELGSQMIKALFGESEHTDVADVFDIHDFEEFDYSKPAWDKSQSRVARNNMLITLMQKRLEDPQTIKDRTTPGGFTHASAAAKYIRTLMGIDNLNYDYSDPWTMVVYNQQNQVAGKLIGIFANQNTNNAIASLMKEFSLIQPIAFGNHPNGLSNLLNPNALTKELLAASVDAVKDPVLNFLNLNTITADSAGMLCRLGYSFEEIGLLMNQPIIRELCEYCMDNNMSDIDTAIDNLLQDWGAKGNYAEQPTSSLTVKLLERGIVAFRDNPNIKNENQDFVNMQAQVLELFRSVYATAKEVGAFVTNTKFTASNAVKSTFGGMYAQQDRVIRYVNNLKSSKNPRLSIIVSDFVDSPITLGLNIGNVEEYMAQILNNPFGYEQVMYDANVQAIKELGKYYPYDKSTYTSIRNFMTGLTKSGLDESTIDQIHEYILRYMIGLDEHSKFNPEYPINLDNGETVRAEDYYTKYVPLKVSNLLRANKELKSLPIFNLLTFEEGSDGNVQMKIADSGALTPTQKDEVRDSWEVLLTNPELSQVAKDLYMYSYYQSGFGFGVIGFNHLAPLELKLQLDLNGETSYTSFLDKVLDDDIPVDEVKFAQMFLSTHRDNNRLVYEPKSKQYNYIKSYVYQNGMPVDSFILDVTTDKNKVKPFILRSTKEEVHYRPAILVDGLLYVANGSAFNRSTSGAMEYRLVKDKSNTKVSLPTSISSIPKANYYTGNITPEANTIFVFGSNPEGRHGAGAAKIAREQFGAIYGQGEGLQGNAYALPTKRIKSITPTKTGQMTFSYGTNKRSDIKSNTTLEAIINGERTATTRYSTDGHIDYWKDLKVGDIVAFTSANRKTTVYVKITKPLTQLNSSTNAEEWSKKEGWSVEYYNSKVKPKVEKGQAYQMEYEFFDANGERTITPLQIIENIKKLYETARQNPDKQFKIAYRNTDKASLNGYTGLEMIDMFLKAGPIPSNIVFSKEWVDTGRLDAPINTREERSLERSESSTAIEGEPIVDLDTMTLDNLVDELVKSQVKTGTLMAEEAEKASKGIRSNILQTTKEDAREQLIGALLEEYKKLGVSCKLNGKKIC